MIIKMMQIFQNVNQKGIKKPEGVDSFEVDSQRFADWSSMTVILT